MRPSLLDPLFSPLTALPGIGPKLGRMFDRLVGEPERPARVIDALLHLPVGLVDRRVRASLHEAPLDGPVTVGVTVEEHRPPAPGGRSPYRVICGDGTGADLTLVFFKAAKPRMEALLPLGAKRWVSGRIEVWEGRMQIVHPDRILDEAGLAEATGIEPVYPATEGLTQAVLRRAARAALTRLPVLPNWLDPAYTARERLPSFTDALRALHEPAGLDALDESRGHRRRLAYDEMLASQLALALLRARMRELPGRAQAGDGRLSGKIVAALPFRLTASQNETLAEIGADLAASKRMLRLLQGDVGSGKTLVALLTMASAVEAGRQAALMAPTEILARQHFERLREFAAPAGLRLAILTGRDRGTERSATMAALAAGEIDIVVGTHALFQESVAFRDLGLAVVDEQHRFGVHQRLALGAKGEAVDVLVMTATPIPRSLVLTYYGDLDVSVLREKPAGRQPIDTRTLPVDRLGEVVDAIGRALGAGAQAYWVCPLVSESEVLDAAAAEERFAELSARFGGRVGLVHGRMKGIEKDDAMARFQSGETRILVATTVIEVGVDVPNASVMVIEHAERFGLAQLHQLRGRIGRGAKQSTCILLYRGPLGETATARLRTLRETEDGFRIAEEDLRLRGEGDLLGRRQSGAPGFKLVRPEFDGDLIEAARDDAKLILNRDPSLSSERGQALRLLLYLFERDQAIRLIRAG